MNSSPSKLQRVSPDELDVVLARVVDEGCAELAIVGPTVQLTHSAKGWPDWLSGYPTVFQLLAPVQDLARRLSSASQLTSLALVAVELGDAGAEHLAALTALTSLSLAHNKVGDAGAEHLAALTALTNLNLFNNEVGDAGAEHLAALTALTNLNLDNNEVGDAGAEHLAALTALNSLDLDNNEVGDAGAEHLAALTVTVHPPIFFGPRRIDKSI